MRLVISIAVLLLACVGCTAQLPEWGRVTTPSSGAADAIGSYANGCLAGAQALPPEGKNYQIMGPSRNRLYGHPTLIAYIEKLSRNVARRGGELLIADMAQPHGGRINMIHSSHQNGLEVDIWYSNPVAESMQLTQAQRDTLMAPSMVTAAGDDLDHSRWKRRHVTLLRLAERAPEVERIFVHPTIKRELCRVAQGKAWLHKIRPWWGHDDHFHVRLQCPASDTHCIAQPANIPPGDGCDATLDWWFTDEAKAAQLKTREVAITAEPLAGTLPLCRSLAP